MPQPTTQLGPRRNVQSLERPVLECRERVGNRPFSRTRGLLLQRDDPENRDDPDEDERAFNEPGGHIPHREYFALSLDDRVNHDGRADVRDDEQQLEERSEQDPVVLPRARDVANGVVEDRLVEHQRRDRRHERDEVQDAEKSRPFLISSHAAQPLSPGDGQQAGPTPP